MTSLFTLIQMKAMRVGKFSWRVTISTQESEILFSPETLYGSYLPSLSESPLIHPPQCLLTVGQR